jgi:hypothetical protein
MGTGNEPTRDPGDWTSDSNGEAAGERNDDEDVWVADSTGADALVMRGMEECRKSIVVPSGLYRLGDGVKAVYYRPHTTERPEVALRTNVGSASGEALSSEEWYEADGYSALFVNEGKVIITLKYMGNGSEKAGDLLQHFAEVREGSDPESWSEVRTGAEAVRVAAGLATVDLPVDDE